MTQAFAPAFKEKVKNTISVENLLEEYVDGKFRNQNFQCIFPDHSRNDTNPSMSYHSEDDNVYCYGCQRIIFDSISFMQKVEGMPFKEAVLHLAEKANIGLPDDCDEEIVKEQNLRDKLYDSAVRFWHNLKYEKYERAKEAKEYLYNRGFTDEIIKEYGIGYCPRDSKYNNDDSIFKNFQGRITFPIRDEYERMRGFSSRRLPGDTMPKYMNVGKSKVPFFNKQSILYGLDKANKSIVEEGFAYLFEGFTDVIFAHKAGIRNAVAAMGTGITSQQLEKLSNITTKVILYLDPDDAGLKAINNSLDLFEEKGLNVEVIYENNGLDPADKIKDLNGKDFNEWANKKAKAPEQMYIDLHLKEYKNKVHELKEDYLKGVNRQQHKLIKNLASVFKYRTERIEVEFFLRSAAEEIGISFDALVKRMRKIEDSRGVN